MEEKKQFSGLLSQLGLGISLGIATVVCTVIVARTYVKIKESQNSIQVKGYSEKRITSENAVWEGALQTSSSNLTEASKSLEELKSKVLALLKQEGYGPKQISLSTMNRHIVYKKSVDGRYDTNIVERYDLSQNVQVSSTDVHKTSTLPDKLNELIFQGYDISPGTLNFYYPSDKLDQLKVSLLADASRSARERAEQFAAHSGNKIGRLLSARQGVFQVTSPNSSDMSDYGTYDTGSIEKIVKIVVTMTYGIE
jgi:uncharacterized protein